MEIRIRSTETHDDSIIITSSRGCSGSEGYALIEITPEGQSQLKVNAKEFAEAAKAIAAHAKS